MDDEGPKYRLEHASNNKSTCQQASCKRNQVKFETGELRIGTHTLFAKDGETRWYMAWRHWRCATKHQIQGLMEATEDDPTKASGFDRLSDESQEQVRLAFEAGKPTDKEFKDIRPDLAKLSPRYSREYIEADEYKADVATRKTLCRGADCLAQSTMIVKGELRLGISIPFDGDHSSWVYKHWKCMSTHDLLGAQMKYEECLLMGLQDLSEDYKQAVIDTLRTGEIVEPPHDESDKPAPKAEKPPRKKHAAAEVDFSEKECAPKKSKRQQGASEKYDTFE